MSLNFPLKPNPWNPQGFQHPYVNYDVESFTLEHNMPVRKQEVCFTSDHLDHHRALLEKEQDEYMCYVVQGDQTTISNEYMALKLVSDHPITNHEDSPFLKKISGMYKIHPPLQTPILKNHLFLQNFVPGCSLVEYLPHQSAITESFKFSSIYQLLACWYSIVLTRNHYICLTPENILIAHTDENSVKPILKIKSFLTPGLQYQAPEVVLGVKNYDHSKAALWTLACTIYEIVTGDVFSSCRNNEEYIAMWCSSIGCMTAPSLSCYSLKQGTIDTYLSVINSIQCLEKKELIVGDEELNLFLHRIWQWNPDERPDLSEIKQYPFYRTMREYLNRNLLLNQPQLEWAKNVLWD